MNNELRMVNDTAELDELLQAGQSFRFYYGEGNRHNKRVHVLAVVDEDHYVYKWWSRGKQCWIYRVDWRHWFESSWKEGYILKD